METCRKLGYRVGKDRKGVSVQIAEYKSSDGTVVAQKVRYPDKSFVVLGSLKDAGLWGMTAWPSKGKRVIVTEGEIDALSVSQAFGNSWPVVSIPSGAAGAEKALKKSVEWLEGYSEIVLLFDNDEPGRQAAQTCSELFTPGKCKIGTTARKDANEHLVAGEIQDICRAVFDARVIRPDGIVSMEEIESSVLQVSQMGRPWFDGRVSEATFGRRLGEVYTFGAGTGVGKTDFMTQQVAFDISQGWTCGVLFLEQNVGDTGKRIAGKHAGKMFHVPDGSWTTEELSEAWKALKATGKLYLYDSFGSMDWATIKGRIRYMVQSLGCEHIYLDHLTALAAAEEDERKAIERIMAEAAGLANELHFTLHMVSHLATPEGKSHEEGGRVTIRHFKGSRAIGFWSHGMFGIERDQQAENEEGRSKSVLRCLKDRYTGRATGKTFLFTYAADTGLLEAFEEDTGGTHGFVDETESMF